MKFENGFEIQTVNDPGKKYFQKKITNLNKKFISLSLSWIHNWHELEVL